MPINENINNEISESEINEIIKENNEIVAEKINSLIEINNIVYAKKLALELIKKDREYKYGYLVLIDIYYEEEDYDSIIELINNALQYIKDDKDLLENKIEALISTYNYIEAKNVIEKLISFGEVSSSVYGQYGVILSIEGKYNDAVEKYKKAISIDNDDILSMINMSIAYKAMYKYNSALEILEHALSINKNDSNIINRVNNMKYLIESSKFEISNFVPIHANPDKFNLIVPSNFDASIDNSLLKIESPDKRISIIISYSDIKYDNEAIKDLFDGFKSRRGELYSVITPISIENREKHNDLFAKFIFTSKINKNDFCNAIAIAGKNNESIILTISSTVAISNSLINFANEIIDNFYIK